MSNTLLTNDIFGQIMLAEVNNALIMTKCANRHYQNDYANNTGATIRIRQPVRYTVTDGVTATPEDITQRETDLTINFRKNISVEVSSFERSLELENARRTIIQPIALQLANQIDIDVIQTAQSSFNNVVGTPGTPVNSAAVVNGARAALAKKGVQGDLKLVLSPDDGAALADSLQNTFNTRLNKESSDYGLIGQLNSFDVYETQNIRTHTVGAYGASVPLVNGAGQTGSTLITDGWVASTQVLNAGDTFTIAGAFAVNPITRQPTIDLQQFIVTADVTSDGAGNATIPISPAINDGTIAGQAPYQNISGPIADNAAITIFGAENQVFNTNYAFHPEAITLATINLYKPAGSPYAQVFADEQTGISIRMVADYDGINDQDLLRFDVLYGIRVFPEYGVRVVGAGL